LVEELIEEASDGIVKFVHNGDANPLLDHDDPLYDIAEDYLIYLVFVTQLVDESCLFWYRTATSKLTRKKV
jgi:hypothetical protein